MNADRPGSVGQDDEGQRQPDETGDTQEHPLPPRLKRRIGHLVVPHVPDIDTLTACGEETHSTLVERQLGHLQL